MALPRNLARRLIGGLALGLVFYVALAIWSDARDAGPALERLAWWTIPAACALSFGNYLVRFWKWQRYLELLDIRVERGTSLLVYLSGLSLSVTPGKMGEVFKAWLLRRVAGTPIHKSAPIVVAERFTDLLGYLILVAVGGLASAREYAWIFWVTLVASALALALVGSQRFERAVVALLLRLPVVHRMAPRVTGSFESARTLLAPREILLPTLVSVIGWGLECTGFWLLANALIPDSTPYLFAVFAFALSAVAGAVAIVAPGGLVVTEGLLGTLLRPRYQTVVDAAGGLAPTAARELARAQAACTVILARLCTLWFAVLVGWIALALFTRRFGAVEELPGNAASNAG